MATAVNKEVKQASKLLANYTKLYNEKAALDEAHNAKVAPLDEKMKGLKTQLEQWAKTHKAEFGTKKTMELEAGTFGHKAGTKCIAFPLESTDEEKDPKAPTLKERYVAFVEKFFPDAIKKDVDSKKVITNWGDKPKLTKALEGLGIKVKQDDNFFITPKK